MLKMCLLLAAYAIAPAVAGHGVMPMAVVLVLASVPGLVLAWGAIFTICASFMLRERSRAQLIVQLAGTLVLYGSWLVNVHHLLQFNAAAEQEMALESMLLLSLPFQVAMLTVLWILAVQMKRALSDHDGESDQG